jgi:hypothetical protein
VSLARNIVSASAPVRIFFFSIVCVLVLQMADNRNYGSFTRTMVDQPPERMNNDEARRQAVNNDKARRQAVLEFLYAPILARHW